MNRIVIPTSADWADADLNDGVLFVDGEFAALELPEAWEGCVGAWSHALDQHPWDYSRNNNHGTRVNGVADHPDGWKLDGTDDHLITATNFSLPAELAVTVWANPDAASGVNSLVMQRQGGANYNFQFFGNGSGLHGRIADDDNSGDVFIGRKDTNGFTTGWHHYAYTWDGGASNSNIKVYRDGVQSDDADDSGGTFDNPSADSLPIEIGSQNNGANNFGGLLDDVRIYNRAPTASLIARLADHRNAAYRVRILPKVFPVAAAAAAVGRGLTYSTKLGRRQLVG